MTPACSTHKVFKEAPSNLLVGNYDIVSIDSYILDKRSTMSVGGTASFRNDFTFEISFNEFLLSRNNIVTLSGLYMAKEDLVAMIFKEPMGRFRKDASFTLNNKRLNLIFKSDDGREELRWVFKRK